MQPYLSLTLALALAFIHNPSPNLAQVLCDASVVVRIVPILAAQIQLEHIPCVPGVWPMSGLVSK